MKDNIRKFFSLLKETKNNEIINEKLCKENKTIPCSFLSLLDTHNFYLAVETNYHTLVFNNYPSTLIKLDEKDIEYFVKKYYPQLEEEMKNNIENIKNQYKLVI